MPFFPDSTQASLFFRSALTIAPFTEHFVLLAERLEQATLSLDKLSIKAVMQTSSECYRHFLRVSSGATLSRKRNRDTLYITTLIVTTMFCNQITNQQRN